MSNVNICLKSTGITSLEECVCKEGFFTLDDHYSCKECVSANSICDQQDQSLPKPLDRTWWVDPTTGDVLPCTPSNAACLWHVTEEAVKTRECAEGYTGYGCRECDADWFRGEDVYCYLCSNSEMAKYIIGSLWVLLVVFLMGMLARFAVFGELNILITFLQVCLHTPLPSLPNAPWASAMLSVFCLLSRAAPGFCLFHRPMPTK